MNLTVVAPLSTEHVDAVQQLFSGEWWSKERTARETEKLLIGSTATVGIFDETMLIGFARVLSDSCYLALILDVIVDKRYRGRGVGDHLMAAVMDLSDVTSVRSVELVCQPELLSLIHI